MTLPHPARFLLPPLATALLFLPAAAFAASPEDIYVWVAEQMGIPVEPVLPEIHFVPKEGLGEALRDSSQPSYRSWAAEYGLEQAEEILNTYSAGIVGLYNARTGVVYVGDFLEGCRREAILAHEFVHVLQLATQGAVGSEGPAVPLVQMLREQEAHSIERRYAVRFCQGLAP